MSFFKESYLCALLIFKENDFYHKNYRCGGRRTSGMFWLGGRPNAVAGTGTPIGFIIVGTNHNSVRHRVQSFIDRQNIHSLWSNDSPGPWPQTGEKVHFEIYDTPLKCVVWYGVKARNEEGAAEAAAALLNQRVRPTDMQVYVGDWEKRLFG